MNHNICTDSIVLLQKESTIDWHQTLPAITHDGLLGLIQSNHMHNFLLWHKEDEARRDDMGFEFVYNAKRNIDKYNQKRNNDMEHIDEFISKIIPSFSSPQTTLHTETPGMIIDRLSILNLKHYHTTEETLRLDTSAAHKQKCLQRLSILNQQLFDLKNSLQELIDQLFTGKRSFRVYYQLKMYNDPDLNPQLRMQTTTQ